MKYHENLYVKCDVCLDQDEYKFVDLRDGRAECRKCGSPFSKVKENIDNTRIDHLREIWILYLCSDVIDEFKIDMDSFDDSEFYDIDTVYDLNEFIEKYGTIKGCVTERLLGLDSLKGLDLDMLKNDFMSSRLQDIKDILLPSHVRG